MELQTPIPIINNTHIELNRLVMFKGEICKAKKCFYIADIADLESSKRKDNDMLCTKIYTSTDVFRVSEKYKPLKETWLKWLDWEKKQPLIIIAKPEQ